MTSPVACGHEPVLDPEREALRRQYEHPVPANLGGRARPYTEPETPLFDDVEAEALRLLRLGLHLRMYGERAPGGNETWAEWDRDTERLIRAAIDLGARR